jgi:membrane-bound lytic murein transglycosylase D
MEALVVPVPPVATPSLHTLVYTTRRGDTLVSIADRFGVSLDQLRRWNKIPSGIKVDPGRRLHVADTSSPHRTATPRRHGGASSPTARPRATTAGKSSSSAKSATHAASKPSSRSTKRTPTQKLYAKKQK